MNKILKRLALVLVGVAMALVVVELGARMLLPKENSALSMPMADGTLDQLYFDEDLGRWPCHQFWKRVTINHDGDVRFCVEDWRNTGLVGNVLETSIVDMWQSPVYERFRELHMSGKWNEMTMCGKCQDWQHMEWDHGFEKAINRNQEMRMKYASDPKKCVAVPIRHLRCHS